VRQETSERLHRFRVMKLGYDSHDPERVIADADLAMCAAKNARKAVAASSQLPNIPNAAGGAPSTTAEVYERRLGEWLAFGEQLVA
jgi:hypothetical protein